MKETFPILNSQERMSQELHASETSDSVRYSALVTQGFEKAGAMGFSFENAMIADGTLPEQIELRKHEIQEKTAELAGWLELDGDFFEKPAHIVLLASVADSLLTSDRYEDNPAKKEKQGAVLQDIAYTLCGKASARVVSEGLQDPAAHDRYVSAEEEDSDKQVEEFYETITDHALTAAVDAILRKEEEENTEE